MKREEQVFASVLVLVLLVTAAVVFLAPPPSRVVGVSGQLSSFTSFDQIRSSVSRSSQGGYVSYYKGGTFASFAPQASDALATGSSSAPSFTTTNIQVQGVDEPDIVKTDGIYLYVSSGSAVSIILAYPPSRAGVVSTMKFPGQVQGLVIAPGRLVVVESGLTNASKWGYVQTGNVFLYDVTNASAPSLIRFISINGSYVDARLSGGYLYAMFQQPTEFWVNGNMTVVMPGVTDGKTVQGISPSSVYYSRNSMVPFSMYTIILSMSVADGAHTQKAILTGWGSTVYASTSNVYLAFPDRIAFPILYEMPLGIRAAPAGFPALLPFWRGGWGTNTTIFRIGYSNGTTQVASEGTVPGTILNQFSVDEFGGYLRVATTSNSRLANQSWVESNNIFVLGQDMSVLGSLQGLAPNEQVYSARFLGDVGYLVTYNRIDPLFAISLSDPTHPAVLSALQLTGFSDYLHPLGDGYLLGVGKQTIPSPFPSETGYVLYEGVKLSLFHVSSDGSSTEVARYLVGDRGSDTPVAYDHKAFLYDTRSGLVALPILVAQIPENASADPFSYGTPVYQGAYLFNFSVAGGFHFIGRVTQVPEGADVSGSSDMYINRILLIGGYVYTLSDRQLLITNPLDVVARLKIPQ